MMAGGVRRFGLGFGMAALLALPVPAQTAAPVLAPLSCLLAANRISQIGSEHIGLVAEVPVRRADRVKAGDVLVRLDPALAKAEVALRQVTADSARARLERAETLATRQLIPAEELETLRSDLRTADATVAQAQLALDKTRILAPFDGVIADVMVSEGELTGNDPLITLIEVSELRAELIMLDSALGEVQLGQTVDMAVPLTSAEITGTVTAIDPFIDPESNTFLVTARVENATGDIPAGVGCSVTGWQD